MSLFKTILSKIFGGHDKATSPSSTSATQPTVGNSPTTATPSPASPPAGIPTQATVDVGAVMDNLAANNPEKLDWKHSIVDLMKLLDMDSSLTSRKELATELHYTGDQGDSAKMNIWLHQQVLRKLAENGGKVPAALLD